MRLTRRRLIWLCWFNSLSVEKQNTPAHMRVHQRRMRTKKIRALISHAHIISAHGIIGTERIQNHSIIWTIAKENGDNTSRRKSTQSVRQWQILAARIL